MSDKTTDTAAPATKTFTQEDIEREKAHSQRFQQEAKEYKEKLKIFEGVDPEQYKKDLLELSEIRKKGALTDPKKFEEEIKRTEQTVRASVQKELDTYKEQVTGLSTKLKELQVTERVFGVAASKFNGDTHEDVKDYIRRYGDINESGEIVFKDSKGQIMYVEGSTTQPMKADDFVKWLVKQKPSWAVATARAGTVQDGEAKGGKESYNPEDFNNMTPSQIDKLINQGGAAGAAAATAFLKSIKAV